MVDEEDNETIQSSARWQRPTRKPHEGYYRLACFGLGFAVLFLFAVFYRTSLSDHDASFAPTRSTASETGQSKIIVASTWAGKDSTWIEKLLPDWQSRVYITDDLEKNKNSTLASDVGHEAAFYLTYIVDNYHNMPDYMVFMHGPRYQWHNDDPMYDAYPTVANLSLDYVDELGYVPLRCDKSPGCDGKDVKHPLPGTEDGFFDWERLLADTFQHFFPDDPIPESLESPCCAQFAVTRDAVHRHSLETWIDWREFIWSKKGLGDALKVGMAMEMLWHVMFGKPPVWCDVTPAECYCKTWGLCDLECGDISCKGRMWKNVGHRLPKGWPDEAVQGTEGWPVEGWWNDMEDYRPPKSARFSPP